jgi:zinc/manganese transport system substrate-binding protein
VVAAENFWGSIARQLGGDKVSVQSIIDNPDTDPHDYEPTPGDARAVASASYVIVNGVGYDPWADKLLKANPDHGRAVLNVGDLVGAQSGGNPHRWYSPPDVQKVLDRITADYKRLSPGDAAYFDNQKATFTSTGLARYNALIAEIAAKYRGVAVGASESVFSPLAEALGLHLITPPSFLKAISEGGEPTAADKATCDSQIKTHQIKAYVFNRQNSTPDVQAQVNLARSNGIPVVAITETLVPAKASFQDWQAGQLQAVASALGSGT